MGLSDFFSDLYAAITIQDVHAEAPSSDMNDSQDQSKGVSTTSEQAGNPSVGGGASTHSPAARSDETSSEESEVNKADARKDGESDDTGHRPRKGGEGDKDDDEEKADSDEEDDDASEGDEKEDGEDEEEEEEEEEPEDLKPKLEEGETSLCLSSSTDSGKSPAIFADQLSSLQNARRPNNALPTSTTTTIVLSE